jgi:hypothetical protein
MGVLFFTQTLLVPLTFLSLLAFLLLVQVSLSIQFTCDLASPLEIEE